ncbi:hypothetical protein IQ06DRAFT_79132 [Phaeosphaeriaceae sp. SRC1lsM3a]|nr:hypothetical protein IQ06DRAFT_79132 [Stagonospora sp. SRC1lsM3a]
MLHTLHSGLSVDATHLPHAHSADASYWQEFWRDGGSGGEYDTPFASLTRAISEAHEPFLRLTRSTYKHLSLIYHEVLPRLTPLMTPGNPGIYEQATTHISRCDGSMILLPVSILDTFRKIHCALRRIQLWPMQKASVSPINRFVRLRQHTIPCLICSCLRSASPLPWPLAVCYLPRLGLTFLLRPRVPIPRTSYAGIAGWYRVA